MYTDALSFLEDERDAWRDYEPLLTLPDDAMDRPVDDAHGWSARDLMGHMTVWQEIAAAIAKELAVGESSPTMERMDAEWDEKGDAVNDAFIAEWATLPLDEVRRRFAEAPGDLRGYLTVVPESRWIKNAAHQASFVEETLEHYEAHLPELRAILAAAGR